MVMALNEGNHAGYLYVVYGSRLSVKMSSFWDPSFAFHGSFCCPV